MIRPIRPLVLLAFGLLSPVALAKKKKAAPEAPKVGWSREEGWAGDCYYPPQWDSLDQMTRMDARNAALDGMESQWKGDRNDGLSIDPDKVTDVDTVLLGRPEKIEAVSVQNLAKCQAVMSGQASASDWSSWVLSLPAALTEGECQRPLDYTMFDYLDIGAGWQRPLGICQGETIHITGSVKDRYRLSEKGNWINVEGDTSGTVAGTDLPCNEEGCFPGQLIMRFQAESGWEKVYPVGARLAFTAPEHGTISYRINDDSFFDNSWYKSRGIEDHTAIEVSPGAE